MKKKILSMLAAIAVAMTLSACQADDTGQTPPLIDSAATIVEETAEPIEMKTIEPPEDGWTVEQLNEVMYLNGKPFKLPCTIEELGENFTIKDCKKKNGNPFDESKEKFDYLVGVLTYDNIDVGYTYMFDDGNEECTIFGIDFFIPNTYIDKELININGIDLFSSRLDIENKIGNLYSASQNNRTYKFYVNDEAIITIIFSKDYEKKEIGDNILFISYYYTNI